LNYAQNRYIRILHDAGMGVLFVDSFGPRGATSICAQKPSARTLTEANRRLDVLGALQWLSTRAGIDAKKLGVVGWSHGGQTVLFTGDRSASMVAKAAVKPTALVAFYPGCSTVEKQSSYATVAPLLVMSGELDNWTPAANCRTLTSRLIDTKQAVRYVQYPGSYHAFDGTSPVAERANVGGTKSGKAMVGGNPEASAASAREMLEFLSREWAYPIDMAILDESVHAHPVPASTAHADLTEVDRVPRLGEKTKAMYREWLEKPFPRAIAISDRGGVARGYGRTAMEYAITTCQKFGSPCRLYAVDDQVVWVSP
jgi:dienelactone hydrolase